MYNCPDCSYRSRWKANVSRHRNMHTARRSGQETITPMKSFICDYCGLQYSRQSSLSVHKQMKHTKTFRFFCGKCNKGFVQLWAYRGHLASHNEALRSKCDRCGSIFNYKNNLKTHQKTCKISATVLSNRDLKHKCSVCNQNYKTLKSLKDHERVEHENQRFKCEDCGKFFKWRSSLSYHKRHFNHQDGGSD